jgi:predicted LPLAT superfamily acyltransferase
MTSQRWTGRGRGTSLGHRIFFFIIKRLGLLPAYLLLFPACIRYVLQETEARMALRRFRRLAGLPVPPGWVLRHFYTFGQSLVDRYAFLLGRASRFRFSLVNEDVIRTQLRAGRGVIVLGAHAGNWEIAGNLLQDRLGAGVSVVLVDAETTVVREATREALARRRVNGIVLTPQRSDSVVAIVAELRRNRIVAMLGDRVPEGSPWARVPFFGAPARFPLGPFAVARATGAAIVPIFTFKTGPRSYTFKAYPPIDPGRGRRCDRDDELHRAVGRYAQLLEREVRDHPYQWYNFFDFWE